MFKNRHFSKYYIYYILILLAFSVIAFNQVIELRAEEPRRAVITIEMMESGNYIEPHLFNLPYRNKPPLFNWVMAGSFFITNSYGEFAARLPGVLSFLLTGLFIFLVGRKYQGTQVALLSAGAYYTIADLLFYGTVNAAEIDLFFSLLIFLQAICIFWFFEKRNWLLLFLSSYLLTALALLTKGLPAIAFQGLTLLVYFIARKEFKKLFGWQHVLGVLLFAVIVLGYFYAYSQYNDPIAYAVNLFKEASQRTVNEYGMGKVLLNLLLFPFIVFRVLLPWSLLTPFLFIKNVRQKIIQNAWLQFSLIFILANIIVYWTAPEMRYRYMYMFFPFFIILFISAFYEAFNELKGLRKLLEKLFNVAIGVGGMALFIVPFLINATIVQYCASFALGVGMLVIAYRFFIPPFTISKLWLLIAAFVFIRLVYNILALPYTQENLRYRNMVSGMIDKAEGKPILYTGDLSILYPNLSVMGKSLYQDTIHDPRVIPYQIPYYYKLKTGSVFKHTASVTQVDTSAYFLVYEDGVAANDVTILERYPDIYSGQHLILFQPKK